jgi:hypothetical protein
MAKHTKSNSMTECSAEPTQQHLSNPTCKPMKQGRRCTNASCSLDDGGEVVVHDDNVSRLLGHLSTCKIGVAEACCDSRTLMNKILQTIIVQASTAWHAAASLAPRDLQACRSKEQIVAQ